MSRRKAVLDSLILLFLASILIAPLFRLEYLDNWPSIESTFISDARMLTENLPHPGWQPLWYCGTRFDYIYPPALRYGTALISVAGRVSTARAYHLYTAVLYVFGIAAVYWLVRAGRGWRVGALLAAAAAALLSPSFLLLKQYRVDSGFWVPQRLHVLMAYGEGPHISALSVLPAALAATFLALRARRPAMLAAAGALCAFTVANNFYGATALAILFPLVVWSVWTGERTRAVWFRAAAIIAIAYGLSAFWLTPSYVRITIVDLAWVSQPGNWPSRIAMALLLGLYCWITRRIGNREREWTVFVCGAAVVFTPWILGLQHGFRVVGEPHRLLPEFDLVMILVVIEVVRHLWSGGPKARSTKLARAVAVAIVVVGFAPAIRYVGHAWTPFPKAGPLEGQYDYRITRWIHDHLPGQRVLPPGTVRFWFDAWFDNAQPDGGSMQGMLNQIIPIATWQILHGDDAHIATLWLQALGTDAVVVPDPSSPEPYRDYSNPQKFRGVLPVLYDDGRGTVIYRVPRAQPGAARVVDASRLPGPIRGGDDRDRLTNYVAAIETPQAAAVNWRGFDEASIDTTTGAGQSVLVQQTFDPAWRARENGRTLPIRREPVMGFMLIDAPSGPHRIDLRFETPLENRIGQILFLLTLAAIMAMLVK